MQLREYQQQARYSLNSLINAKRHPCFVSPTGTGKTRVAVATIADRISLGYKVFVLVTQKEIFDQWLKDFSQAGIPAGYIDSDGVHGRGRSVYVCMVLSLANLLTFLPEKFRPDEIWTDECHHSAADSLKKIYEFYPKASRIGLTATPYRMDNKPLGEFYSDIVQTITPSEAINAGYLAQPLVIAPKLYADKIQLPEGDVSPETQVELLGKAKIIGDILLQYERIFAGAPVLVACATYEHAEYITNIFRQAGWNFKHIHSKLSDSDREKLIKDIKMQRINGLCTVGIGIEGMDIPGLFGLIWLRRTLSLTIYLQFTGRVLRPYKNKKYGIIIDAVGNTFIHGRADMNRSWSLETDYQPTDPTDKSPFRICPQCGVMNSRDNATCHICGIFLDAVENKIKRKFPTFVDGELVMIDEDRINNWSAPSEYANGKHDIDIIEEIENKKAIQLSRNEKINVLKNLTGKKTLFKKTLEEF